jgi:hypothetical protein
MLPARSIRLPAAMAGGALLLIPSLTTCAGGPIPPGGPRQTSGDVSAARFVVPRMSASGCGKSIVYVSTYENFVYIYRQAHIRPCGWIAGAINPQGLFVDKQRNLWVAVAGDCRTQFSSVFEFAPGGTTPIKTLQDPDGPATDVAVDNKSGTVYVTNLFGYADGCGTGNNGVIEVYSGGSTTPTGTLSDPNMNYVENDAVDNQGNLYVTYLELNGASGSGRINEWMGGSGSPVDLGITLKAPGGIQTTKTGALLVCDRSAACGEFAPGSTTMTNLFATEYHGSEVALDKRANYAWVATPPYGLQRFKYPGPDAHGRFILVPNGASGGVATSPAAPQGAPY